MAGSTQMPIVDQLGTGTENRHPQSHHNLCAACMSAPASESTYEATGTIRMRDLRRLDFTFNPNEERSVLIRRHVVLFAMVGR